MYKIIGSDGKEYGPVSADDLRRWIADGRVNGQSLAKSEGDAEFRPLSTFPEFAGALAGGTGGAIPTITPSGFQPAGVREPALQAVKGPAIALMIIAGLGAAYYGLSGIFTLITGGAMFHQELPPNISPQVRELIQGMQGPMIGVGNLVIAALNGLVFFGALKMLRLQSHGLAVTAAVIAMLPCQCCCVLGLPFGIWALVVLNRPEVKSQFS